MVKEYSYSSCKKDLLKNIVEDETTSVGLITKSLMFR
jgi:hypothetical protein